MNKGLELYKNFIDGLVEHKECIESKWVRGNGYPSIKDNEKINMFLESLTDDERQIIAEMLQSAREGGIHDTLAYMDEMVDLQGLTLNQQGETYPVDAFESMHYDFVCRREGDAWPEE